MINGRFLAIQTKAVIIADGGFEGIFNGSGIGFGMDLALRAGLPLRGMEFIGKTPFGVAETKLTLSSNMLGYGANLCDVSGIQLPQRTWFNYVKFVSERPVL